MSFLKINYYICPRLGFEGIHQISITIKIAFAACPSKFVKAFFIMKYYKKDQCYYKVITHKTIIIYDFELLPTVSVTSFIDLQDATEIGPTEFDDAFFRVTNNLKQLCYDN